MYEYIDLIIPLLMACIFVSRVLFRLSPGASLMLTETPPAFSRHHIAISVNKQPHPHPRADAAQTEPPLLPLLRQQPQPVVRAAAGETGGRVGPALHRPLPRHHLPRRDREGQGAGQAQGKPRVSVMSCVVFIWRLLPVP